MLRLVPRLHCADYAQPLLLPRNPCSPPTFPAAACGQEICPHFNCLLCAMKGTYPEGAMRHTPEANVSGIYSSAVLGGSTLGPLATLLRNQELVILSPSVLPSSLFTCPSQMYGPWFRFYIHFGANSWCHVLGPRGCFGWQRICY